MGSQSPAGETYTYTYSFTYRNTNGNTDSYPYTDRHTNVTPTCSSNASTTDQTAGTTHPRKLSVVANSDRARRRPLARDLAITFRPGLCSQRFRLVTRLDNGSRQNRFLFADNSGTAPASIQFHGTG